jgi:hypothetical protein
MLELPSWMLEYNASLLLPDREWKVSSGCGCSTQNLTHKIVENQSCASLSEYTHLKKKVKERCTFRITGYVDFVKKNSMV